MGIPKHIQSWIISVLGEVSDEVGTEKNGKYLLVYEGWSSVCVEGENDEERYRFAERESDRVIEHYRRLVQCVTWAVFRMGQRSWKAVGSERGSRTHQAVLSLPLKRTEKVHLPVST